MAQYGTITILGEVFDLTHLNEFRMQVTIPAKDEKPEQNYPVQVVFTCHCFTRSLPKEGCDPAEHYIDSRDTRQFDPDRHALSLQLPTLVSDLPGRKCFHTGHGNFVAVQIIDPHGAVRHYAVYFALEKAAKNLLLLTIESAFPLAAGTPNPKRGKPIGFNVIVYNRWHNIPIRG